MNVLTLDKKRGSIFTFILYILGTIIGATINYYFIRIEIFKVDSLLAFAFMWSIALHELTHYGVYKYIAGANKSNLNFSKDKKIDIPYFKIRMNIKKKVLFLSLILPFITTSMTIIAFNVITGNFAYCFLLGIGFALSGADFDIAMQLMKQNNQEWKSLDNEFGFIGSDQ